MDKNKVYISGTIVHYSIDKRREAFTGAEQRLRDMGFFPVNPFKNGLPDEAHRRERMWADITLLFNCEYIYMLQGWGLSKGAKLELDVASSYGIKVLFEQLLNIWIMAKEITMPVRFGGTVPEDVSIVDIEERIDSSLENSLRLNFSNSKKGDDDLKEPWIEREDIYTTEEGFRLLVG